ncbi:MAG: GNAT family N-acetyltransferase [Ruminococcus sp.]|nr:GNAT family N-acetyltransferase [Ruminococcus sp.]
MKTLMILCTLPDERLEIALQKAQALGYRTVLCTQGHHTAREAAADRIAAADWSDTRQLVHIAREEGICGVIGLCDAAVTAAAEAAQTAFEQAAAVSRNGAVCVEEFIRNDTLRVIENDIFVMDGHIIWDGMRYCYRLAQAPLRPVYDVYPVCLSERQEQEYKDTVSAVLKQAGIRFGEFNIEGFFTPQGRFFIVEINPRPAGHYTPQTVQMYTGIDLARLLITTAAGDRSYFDEVISSRAERKYKYLLDHSVFSETDGVLDHIHIDESLKLRLISMRYLHGQKEGDRVSNIVDAVRPIAIAVFAFDEKQQLERARESITRLVYPVLKDARAGEKGVFELKDTSKAAALFDGWDEAVIYSCLQGVMGKILVTDTRRPQSACAVLGCFCFCAGKPEPQLLYHRPRGYCILVPMTAQ